MDPKQVDADCGHEGSWAVGLAGGDAVAEAGGRGLQRVPGVEQSGWHRVRLL